MTIIDPMRVDDIVGWPPNPISVRLNAPWLIDVKFAALRTNELMRRVGDKTWDSPAAIRRAIFGKLGEAALASTLGLARTSLYADDHNAGDIDGIEVKFSSRLRPRLEVPCLDESKGRLHRPYVLVTPQKPIANRSDEPSPLDLPNRFAELWIVGWIYGTELPSFPKEPSESGGLEWRLQPMKLRPMPELLASRTRGDR
jgi:hypothetical protein